MVLNILRYCKIKSHVLILSPLVSLGIFRNESSSRSCKCESVCHKKVWNFKILQDWHINDIHMSRITCREWQVKAYMLRVSCWVLGVKSDMSGVTFLEWHFKRAYLKVACQELYVKSDKSRVTILAYRVKSYKLQVKSQELKAKS